MKQNLERQKSMEKENKTDGSDLIKMKYQIQNSLKPFEFEWKTNIEEINSSSSDNEEEGTEAVVWKCSAAGSVENMSLEILQKSQENTCARVFF